jgi:TRAP-type C4-dicarboxylate transport system substrate-binding protein
MMSRKILAFVIALAALASIGSAAVAQTKLIFTTMSPAGSPNDKFFSEWAERVNNAVKGEVEVFVQNGLTLAKFCQRLRSCHE